MVSRNTDGKYYVAITGNARTGKDSLGAYFVKRLADLGIKAQTFSFAYELKMDLNEALFANLGISAFTENAKEKEIIRPILIAYGMAARQINPRFWIEKLKKHVRNSPTQVVIVTDVRFPNELTWAHHNRAISINLERHKEGGLKYPPIGSCEEENQEFLAKYSSLRFATIDGTPEDLLRSHEIFFDLVFPAEKIVQMRRF